MDAAAPPPPAPPRSPLVRILVVVALVLVGVAVPVTIGLSGKEDPSFARVHADFAVLKEALDRYHAKHGSLPEEGSLDFLVPEFLPAVPVDPWGRPYVYSSKGAQVFLATFGRDGERGGAGPEQDHTVHDGHRY